MRALLLYIFCAVALTPLVLEHAPQFSLQAQPAPPSLYLPDDDSDGEPVDTYLEWTSSGTVTFRVQVATDAQFSNPVVDDSGLVQTYHYIGILEHSTEYFWRVAAKDGQGLFAWSAVWKFRTVLSPPALVFPPNNDLLAEAPITLRWDTVRAADYYYLQVSYDTSFTYFEIDKPDITTNSYLFSNPYPYSQYYWRVRGEGQCCEGEWSLVWRFNMDFGPDNIAPPNNATNVAIPTEFEWSDIDGVSIFELAVAEDPGFQKLAVSLDTLTIHRYTAAGLDYGKTYHWRVRAWTGQMWGGWSQPWSLTTANPPIDTVVLRSPLHGAMGVTPSPLLEWNSAAGASTYRMQLSLDPSFGAPVEDVANLSTLSYQANGLLKGVQYYWRVRGDAVFGSGAWSEIRSFTTGGTVPILRSPANGAQFVALLPTLEWLVHPSAFSFRVQLARDLGFTDVIHDEQVSGNSTSFAASGLEYGKQYYWRVHATDAGGPTDWSEIWTFFTPPVGPGLVAPASGSTLPNTNVTLEWMAVSGATSFHVQVADDAGFSAILAEQQSIMSTTWQPSSGLVDDQTFYWRVKAEFPSGESDWSEIWNFSIGKPLPVLLSPPNNAIDQPTTVQLGWQDYDRALSFRVQVARDGSFNDIVQDQNNLPGLTHDIIGLDLHTEYYWRILATTATGDSPWSETWQFTTEAGMPELVAPANNATDIPFAVELNWKPYSRATSYRVEVAKDDQFADIVDAQDGITGLTHDVSGLERLTVYYWRVLATTSIGNSKWSEVWQFTTKDVIPELVSPMDNAPGLAIPVEFLWRSYPGADSYRIQLATDDQFTSVVADEDEIAGTQYEAAGLDEMTTYYWRILASTQAGDSPWSETWSFTTAAANVPVLVSPAHNASGLPPSVELAWEQYSGALSYRVQVARDGAFTDILEDQDMITGEAYTLDALEGLTPYYWRVLATISTGDSPWSAAWMFTTATQIPTLDSPADGAPALSVPVTFAWDPVAGAARYSIQVATDEGFASVVAIGSGINGLSYVASGLAPSRTHYWRVRADFSFGAGPWSDAWMFTTEGGTPVLLTPANMATDVPVSPMFTWAPAAGAPGYELQVATDAVFSAPVVNETGIAGTSYNGATLQPGTQYYWKVRVTGGQWTQPWSFTTITDTPLPGAPVLLAPADQSSGIQEPVLMRWQPVAGADTYTLEVSDMPGMPDPFIVRTGLTGTESTLTELETDRTYYWRVSASNGMGSGPYSPVWSFTTEQSTGVLTVQYPAATLGSPVTVNGTLPAGFSAGEATLFFKPIGAADYDSAAMAINGVQMSGEIAPSAVTIRGLAAWVRVVSADGQTVLTDPESEPSTTPEYIRVSFNRVESPLPFTAQQYAMVSVPADLDDPAAEAQLLDDYGEYDRRLWRALRWNGTSYDEFPDIDGLANTGALWLITQVGRGFDVARGQSIDPSTQATLTLAPGWTQIGGPYAFNVDWAAIPGSSALTGPFAFDGVEYIPDSPVLEPWKGYFVFNGTASQIVLNVPPVESTQVPGKTASAVANASFLLRLSMRDPADGWRDTYNDVGLAIGEAIFVPEPPPVTSAPSLSVIDGTGKYLRILSPPGMDGNTWEYEMAATKSGMKAAFQLHSEGSLPSGWSFIVIDAHSATVYPSGTREFTIETAPTRRLIVAAGTEDYLKRVAGRDYALAQDAGLGENYPNPFNPSTVIPFVVDAPVHVQIGIFDIHGRRVRTLADASYAPGRYSLHWTGVDKSGATAPAGTYLCRMMAGGRVWTLPLTLTK